MTFTFISCFKDLVITFKALRITTQQQQQQQQHKQ